MSTLDESTFKSSRDAEQATDRIVEEFEGFWREGNSPALDDFLPECPNPSLFLLTGLVRADLKWRLRAGEPVRVETYLARYPRLASDRALLVDLLAAEWEGRRLAEPALSFDEYRRRFPDIVEKVQARIQEFPETLSVSTISCTFSLPTDTGHPDWPSLPNYEILGVLGRGGMGVVYKARQLSLNRIVALKMLPVGIQASADQLTRFQGEARAVARLKHPHIVQIFEIGQHDGRPFFSLELVEGGNLAEKLAGAPLLPRTAAELVKLVSRAVHHGHALGIIHRDLKPANILLQPAKSADVPEGREAVIELFPSYYCLPKVTDFGLAKHLEEDSGQTRTGAILGTPSYMAPEQAAGLGHDISPATDVYSLGVLLYELLTGKPPFRGKTYLETLEQVKKEDPLPPKRYQPKVPADLQTICLTCLRKEPRHRYGSALALAEDLNAFLTGESIRARPMKRWEKMLVTTRRRPGLMASIGVGFLALLGLGAGIWWYNPVTVGAVAVLSLLMAAAWYNARLQNALKEGNRQRQAVERNFERLHLLLDATRQLITSSDTDAVLHLIGQTTARLVNAERATIYLLTEGGKELWSRVALGVETGEIHISADSGIAGKVVQTGEIINIDDAYADPRFNPEIDRKTGYKTRNLLTFPMKDGEGKIVGVFQVLNKRDGPFEAEDVEMLSTLAGTAALCLTRAK